MSRVKHKLRRFYASAPKGMGELLVDELRDLGAQRVQGGIAGASFDATLETAYRLCLWGRVVNRVLMPITDVPAATPEQLYEEVHAIRWERHLAADGTLAVDCTGIKPAISHTRYAALKTKDAIVDRLREQFGERPSVDLEQPDLRINLHLRGDRARIAVDLSGGSLHRRGYRIEGAAAPLKENLAAAILLLAGWPDEAARGAMLLDPMCGSGTFLIEGALMAAGIAPGLLREHFGFTGWRGHDRALWRQLLEEAEQRRQQGLAQLPPIQGFDASEEALEAARGNIERAGLDDYITVSRHELSLDLPLDQPQQGLLVINPPYGERLGEVNELKPLYGTIGELLRGPLSDWPAAVFTGNPELAAQIGLQSERPVTLYNGPLECRLFRYRPRPSVHISEDKAETLASSPGAQMFANRLKKNLKRLRKWARREDIHCYRVYDADLPEYAVAVDLYRGEKLWVHVQEYEAPQSVDEEKVFTRMQEVLAVLPQLLEVPPAQIFYKVRKRQKGTSQYEKQAQNRQFHEVREGPCRLLVNFSDYLDTGLFLDHRITRQMIGAEARGKRFLNLFAYTGTATVHAALGKARGTTTVDMSRTYLDWARRNLKRNGISGAEHELIQADCTAWLAEQAGKGTRQYDLIFLDPPTFSSSKRMAGTLDIQRDHVRLLTDAARLLSPGGSIIFSNNYRRFRLDEDTLAAGGLTAEDISRSTLPADFERNPRIHRCWRIRKTAE